MNRPERTRLAVLPSNRTPLAVAQRYRALALLAGVVLGVAACGSAANTGPVPVLPGAWEGGDNALHEGVLVLQDGCLVIDNGQMPLLLAVQRGGVSWNSDRQELRVFDHTYRVGETVTVGGGAGAPASQVEWDVPPADNCMDYPVWFMSRP